MNNERGGLNKDYNRCDVCGKMMDNEVLYHIIMKADRYFACSDTNYIIANLEFCKNCAIGLKEIIEKLRRKADSN